MHPGLRLPSVKIGIFCRFESCFLGHLYHKGRSASLGKIPSCMKELGLPQHCFHEGRMATWAPRWARDWLCRREMQCCEEILGMYLHTQCSAGPSWARGVPGVAVWVPGEEFPGVTHKPTAWHRGGHQLRHDIHAKPPFQSGADFRGMV